MERYSKEQHFVRLKETTETVKNYIMEYFDKNQYVGLLKEESIWQNRILIKNSLFLRPLIVRNVMEMLYADNTFWLKYLDLISSVELFNISTYQADKAFDNRNSKYDTNVRHYMSSYITYTIANEFVSRSNLKESRKIEFLKIMNLSCKKVYEGQFIDSFILDKKSLNLPVNKFLKSYLLRCKNLDGYQLAMCFYYGFVRDDFSNRKIRKTIKSSLYNIGINLGICLQILNDMNDLCWDNQGNFLEDTINHKITYPIYLLWYYSDQGRQLLREIWVKKIENMLVDNLTKYKTPLKNIFINDTIILEKLLQLLYHFFNKISSEIKALKRLNIDITLLDFIFPHIFLSRIIKCYNPSSRDLNKLFLTISQGESHV